MVPTPVIPTRGRSPARASSISDDDDNWTVYSDSDSISDRRTRSRARLPPVWGQYVAPRLRVKRGQHDKPVYEAWNVHYFPQKRVVIDGSKVLGVQIENFDQIAARTDVRPQPSTQSELANTHLRAIEDFQAKHKRCLALRAFRAAGKSYEQDLEERCRAMPEAVKMATTNLLFDRGRSTSTPCHTRTWTVVAMREQLRHRFAEQGFTEVKRHKLRFWKNRNREEPLVYTLIIRGAATDAADGGEINSFSPFANPWLFADRAEMVQRSRERFLERESLRCKSRAVSPSFRRSVSPPSYRSSVRSIDRSPSPPPYRRRRLSPLARSISPIRYRSPIRSRSPSVRIRVRPRFSHRFDDITAPTPPESFTPPPGVSAYRPPPGPTPFAPSYLGQFPPPPPPPLRPSSWIRPPLQPPPMPVPTPPAPATFASPSDCIGCRATPPCTRHSPQLHTCVRPLMWFGGVAYHRPCPHCPANFPPTPPPPPPRAPFDHLSFQFPETFPPAPRLSPLTTPTLSSPSSTSPPPFPELHTPTMLDSVAPEVREDSRPGSPGGSQNGARSGSPVPSLPVSESNERN